jgi:hypothetical protein
MSEVFSVSGRPLAIARALWIEVPESAFPPARAPAGEARPLA